jgi:uncharacterized damage-inducible protein DinB
MGPNEYQDLLRHMEWADALIWEAVLRAPDLGDGSNIRGRLHHFHTTQWAYLQLWRDESLRLRELSSFPDLGSLCRWARGYYRELAAFSETLSAPALQRTVEFPWAEHLKDRFGSIGPATLGETILQIAHHTTHHRGQVATVLRAGGGEPPMMDFIAWVWMRRPAPRWPDLDTGVV